MNKYKICPACGAKNNPSSMDCKECFSDLIGVHITDDSLLQNAIPVEKAEPTFLYKICDCGERNAPNARKCAACGEDISDIVPLEAEDDKSVRCLLQGLDCDVQYQITECEVVLGRESEWKSYLCTKKYVSRKHCRIIRKDDSYYIENLSQTNPTFVNNRRIDGIQRLNDGDEIGLGGFRREGQGQEMAAYFKVCISK